MYKYKCMHIYIFHDLFINICIYTHTYISCLSATEEKRMRHLRLWDHCVFCPCSLTACACVCCVHVLGVSLSAGGPGLSLHTGWFWRHKTAAAWTLLGYWISWQKAAVLWQQIDPARFPYRCGADVRFFHTPAVSELWRLQSLQSLPFNKQFSLWHFMIYCFCWNFLVLDPAHTAGFFQNTRTR